MFLEGAPKGTRCGHRILVISLVGVSASKLLLRSIKARRLTTRIIILLRAASGLKGLLAKILIEGLFVRRGY